LRCSARPDRGRERGHGRGRRPLPPRRMSRPRDPPRGSIRAPSARSASAPARCRSRGHRTRSG
jgi:hypothetical protein